MHAISWHCVSGLQLEDSENVILGPVIEEAFWKEPDIAKYCPESESVESFNIGGPYDSYTDYVAGAIRVYEHAIHIHASLESMRNLLPRLDAFVSALAESPDLNNTRYVLAHKDLHFANHM